MRSMPQAMHIFKKDVRHLRREISLVAVLTAALVWLAPQKALTSGIEILLAIAASYMIARLVHAEAIPGDRQFWTTRPYRWQSLLPAKLLFILTFIHTPILLAHVLIVLVCGFPVVPSLPGLLWSQLLLFFGFTIPVTALAAMTSGLVPFTFTVLALFATVSLGSHTIFHPRHSLGPVEWVRNSLVLALLIGITAPILYWQYKRRRTMFSRVFALGGAVLGVLAYALVPWPLAFRVQSNLRKATVDYSELRVAADPSVRPTMRNVRSIFVEVALPIVVTGIPPNVDIHADGLTATLRTPDGRTWKTGSYDSAGLSRQSGPAGTSTFRGTIPVDQSFFRSEGEHRVTLNASIYLTLFGNPKASTFLPGDKPVNIMDGLQCYAGLRNDVFCRSVFRWPERMVDVKIEESGANTFTRFISYSPFPAHLNINPIETRWASAYTSREPHPRREVTITSREPIAHLQRDFEVRELAIRVVSSTQAARN